MTVDISRREFVKTTAVTTGLAVASPDQLIVRPNARQRSVIQILLTGGPSQLDTWDPKPGSAAEIRGPFRPIATATPGTYVSELFPRIARITNKIALLRTLHHEEAPIHETGHQLVQTGKVFHEGTFPHFGAVASYRLGKGQNSSPAWVGLPTPLGNTGVPIPQGQDAGSFGAEHGPVWMTPHEVFRNVARETAHASRFGESNFGQACHAALHLVEAGVRVVTINMFDTVFSKRTWDMHAYGGSLPTTLEDYRRSVCPTFDQAYSRLITSLEERGMLDDVLVVATGEMGRTPKINSRGGRDHWNGCWTALMAGGGIQGGAVLGESDATACAPKSRPITPAELVATIYDSLGLDSLDAGISAVAPLRELF